MSDGTPPGRRIRATSRPGSVDDFAAMPDFLAAEGGVPGLSECGLRILCEVYSRSRSGGGVLTAGVDRLAAKARATVDEAAAALAELQGTGLIERAPCGGWAAVPEQMDRLRDEYLRYWDAKERLAELVGEARSRVVELRAAGADCAALSAAGAAGAGALSARGLSADDFEAAADELSRLLDSEDASEEVQAEGGPAAVAGDGGDSDSQP